MSELSQAQIERMEHALEGLLEAEEWETFQEEVVADPTLREAWVEHVWLHGQLRADRETLPKLLEEPEPQSANPELPFAWLWATGIAAVFAALLGILLVPNSESEAVAVLWEAQDCKWAGSELPTAEGSKLGTGTLKLVEGMATLRFESGATVTLEAPSTLEVLSKMRCRLLQGSLVADVPDSAHGFTVDTPEMEVVDLGTRFGVTTAGAMGNSQVFVFEGEVEVARAGEPEPKRLLEGKSLRLGGGDISDADVEPQRIEVPEEEEEGWLAIPTSFGAGKDAYIRRTYEKRSLGREPLVMVKHTDLAIGNQRKGYLTFDLNRVELDRIQHAELVVDLQPSGLGFSALVPDSRFSVYGLTEESLDSWEETEVLWSNAPANLDEGLRDEQVRFLAEFSVKRGAPSGRLVISGEGIADFLREDTNGLATFILVRETGESDRAGLVHALASKEHPTARPPTLRIQTF